jgi:hypothetical protein
MHLSGTKKMKRAPGLMEFIEKSSLFRSRAKIIFLKVKRNFYRKEEDASQRWAKCCGRRMRGLTFPRGSSANRRDRPKA